MAESDDKIVFKKLTRKAPVRSIKPVLDDADDEDVIDREAVEETKLAQKVRAPRAAGISVTANRLLTEQEKAAASLMLTSTFTSDAPDKSAHQVQMEKYIETRLRELDRSLEAKHAAQLAPSQQQQQQQPQQPQQDSSAPHTPVAAAAVNERTADSSDDEREREAYMLSDDDSGAEAGAADTGKSGRKEKVIEPAAIDAVLMGPQHADFNIVNKPQHKNAIIVPEVELPVEFRLRNIEETKAALQKKRSGPADHVPQTKRAPTMQRGYGQQFWRFQREDENPYGASDEQMYMKFKKMHSDQHK